MLNITLRYTRVAKLLNLQLVLLFKKTLEKEKGKIKRILKLKINITDWSHQFSVEKLKEKLGLVHGLQKQNSKTLRYLCSSTKDYIKIITITIIIIIK